MKQASKVNPSIKCSVTSCAYHAGDTEMCTLNTIQVGCTQQHVGTCDRTECASFQLGDHGTDCGCK